MKLSVVIPAHNEEGCIHDVVSALADALRTSAIPYEILIVNDNSTDRTETVLSAIDADRTGVKRIGPEDRAHHLGASRADQPGKSEDFAGAQRETHVVKLPRRRQVRPRGADRSWE